MADTSFPPGLTRAPRVDALSEDAPDVVIRSEVDAGPALVRRRFTGDRRTFSVQLDLTRTELATFDEFFLTTTKGGSLSFEWKHPRTASLADFRFLKAPNYRPRAPRGDGSEWWVVSFEMELLPGTDQSIEPPSGGGDPHGGTWLLLFPGSAPWLGSGEIIETPAEEFEDAAIVAGVVWEADAAPPDFVPDLHFRGYSYLAGEDESQEIDADDGSASSASAKSSETSTTSSSTPSISVISSASEP